MNSNDIKQCFATPWEFFGVLSREFNFDIDVCATAENAKCDTFITPEIDALNPRRMWIGSHLGGRIKSTLSAWCNPGFRNVLPWHEKAYAEAQKDPRAVVVVIGLPGGSQDWYKFAAAHASEIRLLADRVHFIPPEGIKDYGNSRDSWLFIYRRKRPSSFLAPHWIFDWRAEIQKAAT